MKTATLLLTGSTRDVVNAIAASLTEHREQWTFDRYTATHECGVYVWVANDHYGLEVGIVVGTERRPLIGGVTGWSSFFGPLIPWRRRLLRLSRARPEIVQSDDVVSMLAA